MADDLETWYAELVARALLSFFKYWPLIDFDLLYSNVKLVTQVFSMGKGKHRILLILL